MSTAQLVVQHLPYLRRYARALTGSQMAGDAYVAATLETLVNEPETIGQGTNVKVDLFRVFTRIWNSLSVNGKGEQIQRDLPAEVRLGQITPLPRQAFLRLVEDHPAVSLAMLRSLSAQFRQLEAQQTALAH